MEIEAIAAQAVASHALHGGSTVNLDGENLLGRKLFAIGIFTELSRSVKERELPIDKVRSFLIANEGLLKHPFLALGTWYDASDERTFLDISVVVESEELAFELGKEFNQLAIFDLHREREIPLSGDGTTPDDKIDWTNEDVLAYVADRIAGG